MVAVSPAFLSGHSAGGYLARMMKVAGHRQSRLLELQGYGHGMTFPAFPLVLEEIRRIRDHEEKR